MNKRAADKIRKARAGLILDNVFFGSLALKMDLKEDPGAGTCWTDGRAIGYDPAFIETLNINQVKGLLAHEIMHVALKHNIRRGGRDQKNWNIAADLAINPILLDCNFEIPDGALYDPALKDKSAENIFNGFKRDPESQNNDQENKMTDDNGQDEKNENSANSEGENGPDGSMDPGNEENDGTGDGSGGGAPGPENFGEVRDLPGSAADAAEFENNLNVALKQAATLAKKAGTLPGALDKLIDETVNSSLDWRTLLRQFLEMSAKNDYSMSRPNKRFIAMGLYMPSLYSEDLKNIIVAVDCSGSTLQDISAFFSEIDQIVNDFNCTLTVISHDTRITAIEEFSANDLPIRPRIQGGGGTDFRPVFEYIENSGADPAALIFLTDLYGPFPDQAPGYPVLWISTSDERAPFGDTVRMSADV